MLAATDKVKYKIIIIGILKNFNEMSSIKEIMINRNFSLLLAQ